MPLQFTLPKTQIVDANGNPIASAKLRFYAPGTTTPKDVYSNYTLTTVVSQPVTADASGRIQQLFMSGVYKVRVYAADGTTLIYEYDDCDYDKAALSGTLAVGQGGTGATTAESARSNLGAAAQTSVDTLTTSVSAFFIAPGGRLTLASGTPVIASDQAAKTTVYYTPYIHGRAMLYNGTAWAAATFTETSQTLADATKSPAAATAANLYDMFLWNDAGTTRCTRGPAWVTPTAGSGARGIGAGTTELERVNGVWVNKIAITNGPLAQRGLYAGTIFVNASVQCQQLISWGQNREWGVWNAYNREKIRLQMGDATPSWPYNSTTIRQSNAAAGNRITLLCGLPEEPAVIKGRQSGEAGVAAGVSVQIGVGWNSTTAISGFSPAQVTGISATTPSTNLMEAEYNAPPFIGINNANALEKCTTAAQSQFNGGEANMLFTAEWQG